MPDDDDNNTKMGTSKQLLSQKIITRGKGFFKRKKTRAPPIDSTPPNNIDDDDDDDDSNINKCKCMINLCFKHRPPPTTTDSPSSGFLKSLIEGNAFYSPDCNVHIDVPAPQHHDNTSKKKKNTP